MHFRDSLDKFTQSVFGSIHPFLSKRKMHSGGSKKRRSKSKKHGSKRISKSMRRKSIRR